MKIFNDAELIETVTNLARACGRNITGQLLHKKLEIPLPRALELIERLQNLGVLGAKERSGHPLLTASASNPGQLDSVGPGTSVEEVNDPAAHASSAAGAAKPKAVIATRLKLDRIRADAGQQIRAGLNPAKVEEYADLMKDGAAFPPVSVFEQQGEYLLVDGFHRFEAARRLGHCDIGVEVDRGSKADMLAFAVRVNGTHGLPLTSEEKKQVALRFLKDPECAAWNDQEIARKCGLSRMTISRLRKLDPGLGQAEADIHNVNVKVRKVRRRDGTVYELDVSKSGRKRRASSTPSDGSAPLGQPSAARDPVTSRIEDVIQLLDALLSSTESLLNRVRSDAELEIRLRARVQKFQAILDAPAEVANDKIRKAA